MSAKRSSAQSRRPVGGAGESSERLALRRQKERRRTRILFGLLLLTLAGAFIWLNWQPYLRISQVTLSVDDSKLEQLVKQELTGTYFGIVPRDSYFFVPEHAIREALISADPSYQAVSVKHVGLTGIAVSLHARVPVAEWCGLQKTVGVAEYCYLFDAEGYIFAREGGPIGALADVASATPRLNAYSVYDSLKGEAAEPLLATLAHAVNMPDTFDFARKVEVLGSPVSAITFHADEVDLLFESGTRLTYLLGKEEAAFADLISAKANINLADGSIEYVDLRFPGKVYVKKKNESPSN